jgi:hypothetical protein
MKRALALIAASGLAAPCFAASSVYRCVVDGKTVYQDQPCKSGKGEELVTGATGMKAVDPRASKAGAAEKDVALMSLDELGAEILDNADIVRWEGNAYRERLDAIRARAKTGGRENLAEEAGKILAQRAARVQALEKRNAAIRAEIARRCPRGDFRYTPGTPAACSQPAPKGTLTPLPRK